MTRVSPTRGLLLAAGLVAGLTLAGCGASPSAAITVDGASISQAELTNRTQELAGDQTNPALWASFNRRQLTEMARHELLARAAAEHGLTVTNEEAEQASQAAAPGQIATELQVPTAQVPSAWRDFLMMRKLLASQPKGFPVTNVTVSGSGVLVTDYDQALAVRDKLREVGRAAAVVADAGANGIPQSRLDLLTNIGLADSGLFIAQPGDVLILPQQKGYAVIRVGSRTVAPATLTVTELSAATSLQDLMALGSLALAPYEKSVQVQVNPRYGKWDPLAMQVVSDGIGV